MLLNGTCLPDSLAARFNCSFCLTRLRKSERHFECLTEREKNDDQLRLSSLLCSLTVFNTNIDTFSDDTVAKSTTINDVEIVRRKSLPNTFVHDDTDGMSGDVEDTTGFTVIESMWHTLLDRTIALEDGERAIVPLSSR